MRCLPANVRPLRVLAVIFVFVALATVDQAQASTSTALAITSGGGPVSSVIAGTVVTITATVTAGSTPITPGLVTFCDASAAHCTDIHIAGTAQLTKSGTAVIKFRPGIGSHTYKAIFAGTKVYAGSTSDASPLSVTGLYPTSTTFSSTGGLGIYNVTTTVTGTGLDSSSPSGTVSFLDTSNSNALTAQATMNASTPKFNVLNPASPQIAKQPSAIATGDFNGDGIPDLAITSRILGTITIWLGNGDGTFRVKSTTSTGPNPDAIAVADFNSDGIPDLAVANFYCGLGCTGSVTILLGKGDGTFTPTAISPSAGSGSSGIVAGDFNGDGIADLAVANFDGDSITVLLGNGDGTFSAAPVITFPFNTTPPFICAADFNGDGKLDLATFSNATNQAIVLLGKGDGTFPTSKKTTTNFQFPSAAVADLNGDGIPDLVLTPSGSTARVLLGTGSGTFTTGASLRQYLESSTIGDFNGDGIPDVAGYYNNEIFYFLGAGDGTFKAATTPTFTAATIFVALATADFNGDGLSDVAGPGNYAYITRNYGLLVPLLSAPAGSSTGSTSLTLGAGVHVIEASYGGDTNYNSSTSPTATLAGPDVTTLTVFHSGGPYTYGNSVKLTATLSPYTDSGYKTNGEPVSFYNNGAVLGTAYLTGGVATWTLSSPSAGQYSFTANYAGDGRFLASNSNTNSLTISLATPAITWAKPANITYGTPLGATQLDATANVPGTFVYSPAAGSVLPAGANDITATFTPTDTADYMTAKAAIGIWVNKATPAIAWAAPAAITYGAALSSKQLDAVVTGVNGKALAGTTTYSPVAGTILTAGTHTLSVTFTPTDTADYTANKTSVSLTGNQAQPAITWATPAAITYGTPLSATQLDAKANVPGTFVYSPPLGAVLSGGAHTLTATFTPTDTTDYNTAIAKRSISVNPATPAITWAKPANIAYGTPLSATQLDAKANVPGTFVYSPAAGTMLPLGSNTLTVTFTPTDATDYTTAKATTGIWVSPATPTITWATPASIVYGTPLSATQLDATANVPGTLVYSPAAGAVLAPGTDTLSVTFTPTDTADYVTTARKVMLSVLKATPVITWAKLANITYGTALSATQLDATANVPGTFVYSPAAGAVLSAGANTLTVTFTPTNTADYNTAKATLGIWVYQAAPTITWPTPASITAGTALSATQLDAAVTGVDGKALAGTSTYSPAAGTVLASGKHTLTVTFTPTNSTDYKKATASVTLTVQ